MQLTIEETSGRKVHIGQIIEHKDGKVFYKEVSEKKHLMRKLNAWGIDEEQFRNVILPTCDYIYVEDKASKVGYITKPSVYKEFGRYLQFGEHRRQIFLPRTYFRKLENGAVKEEMCREALQFLNIKQ